MNSKPVADGNMKPISTEFSYFAGIIILAAGTALMERADFGVSMVVAPAYLIHLKLCSIFPFFSFGMAEYAFQACIIIIMCLLLRRFRISYLFSFLTAVIYGHVLDLFISILKNIMWEGMHVRLIYYVFGVILCALGVSFLFHTYLPPEAYELVVRECSEYFHININHLKTLYDCISCLFGILLSFIFFGFWHFEGVKLGTVICALINGSLIGFCTCFLEKRFVFYDSLNLRNYF